MMTTETISAKDVQRIAVLARLALTEQEATQAAKDLQGVLAHFSQIQSVDTEGVSPAESVSGLSNVAREDVARPEALCATSELMERVPETEGGQIKVRSVFSS